MEQYGFDLAVEGFGWDVDLRQVMLYLEYQTI